MEESKATEKQHPWLIKVQQESWQAEIILSGLIIFTLIKIPGLVSDQFYILGSQYLAFTDLGMFEDFIKTGVYWLIGGFIVHLVLRGVWAGFVGLSYTFPNGIVKERTQFAPRFQRIIEKIPTPVESIITLEKYCSVLFSVAFMLFMVILGLSLFNLVFNYFYAWIFLKLGIFNSIVGIILNVVIIAFVLLYLFDFLSAGLIKKIKWLAPIYYPAYRVLNLVTLSFLYRNIYYTFVTNFGRTKVVLALVTYVIVTFFIFGMIRFSAPRLDYFDYNVDSFIVGQNYDNLRGEDSFIRSAAIQSDIIDNNVLRLFIVYRIIVDEAMKDCISESEFKSMDPSALRTKKLECLDDYYIIKLDGIRLKNLSWKYHINSQTKEYGIISWIDISDYPKGNHEIIITFKNAPAFTSKEYIYAYIPFFKNTDPDSVKLFE